MLKEKKGRISQSEDSPYRRDKLAVIAQKVKLLIFINYYTEEGSRSQAFIVIAR